MEEIKDMNKLMDDELTIKVFRDLKMVMARVLVTRIRCKASPSSRNIAFKVN